jgi:predicted nucleic acid-binding protein
MVVISDTSPLTALLLAGRELLVKQMFDRVVIPPAVEKELLRAHAELPAWIEVLTPGDIPLSVSEAGLDPGETEAISLALELRPETVLMDERLGRRLAAKHGLKVTGLLGLLVMARQKNLIHEVRPLILEMIAKGKCWFDQSLLESVCNSVGEKWG